MKAVILSILLLASSFVYGQSDCKKLHVGKFRIESEEIGTTNITRTKKTQTEINDTMGVHVVYEITWIDDCTYRIRPTKVIKGDPAIMGRPGDFVTVKILEVREKSYIARATSNFADFELDLEVEIVD